MCKHMSIHIYIYIHMYVGLTGCGARAGLEIDAMSTAPKRHPYVSKMAQRQLGRAMGGMNTWLRVSEFAASVFR